MRDPSCYLNESLKNGPLTVINCSLKLAFWKYFTKLQNTNLATQSLNLCAQNANLCKENSYVCTQNTNLCAQTDYFYTQNTNLHVQNAYLLAQNANLCKQNAKRNANLWQQNSKLYTKIVTRVPKYWLVRAKWNFKDPLSWPTVHPVFLPFPLSCLLLQFFSTSLLFFHFVNLSSHLSSSSFSPCAWVCPSQCLVPVSCSADPAGAPIMSWTLSQGIHCVFAYLGACQQQL